MKFRFHFVRSLGAATWGVYAAVQNDGSKELSVVEPLRFELGERFKDNEYIPLKEPTLVCTSDEILSIYKGLRSELIRQGMLPQEPTEVEVRELRAQIMLLEIHNQRLGDIALAQAKKATL